MSEILLVDDHEPTRTAIRKILVASGYRVVEAGNGLEALERAHVRAPDLLITDIIMPQKEGIETIREFRAAYPQVRIMAISGGGRAKTADFLEIARAFGADEVLKKPFQTKQFLQAVKRVLAAHQAADSNAG